MKNINENYLTNTEKDVKPNGTDDLINLKDSNLIDLSQ